MKTKLRSFSLTILTVFMFVALAFANVFSLGSVSARAEAYAAKIGNQGYATLAEAINAAEVGDTVVLNMNITTKNNKSSSIITIESGKDFTLDLSGRELKQGAGIGVSEPLIEIEDGAKLTVTDTSVGGKISANRIAISLTGTLVLNAGTISAGENSAEDTAYAVWLYAPRPTADTPKFIMNGGALVVGEEKVTSAALAYDTEDAPENLEENVAVTINGGEVASTVSLPKKANLVVNGGFFANALDAELVKNFAIYVKGHANGYFNDVYEAFAAAKTGDTIVLLKNITTPGTHHGGKYSIKIADKSITLDLNGKTLAQPSINGLGMALLVIRDSAELTVIDSVGGGKISATCTAVQLTGKLVLESGTIAVDVEPTDAEEKESFAYPIWVYAPNDEAAPTFIMNGGALLHGEKQIDFEYACAISFDDYETTKDNLKDNVTIEIKGGTITGTLALNDEANVRITGGTFAEVMEEKYLPKNANVLVSDKGAEVNPKNLNAATVKIDNSANGTFYYTSFELALAAAKANDKLVLLKDVSLDKQIIIDKALTLNLNGKTLTLNYSGYDYAVWVKDSFTITGEGFVVVNAAYGFGVNIKNSGVFTIENGAFTQNNGSYLIGAFFGKVVINNGAFIAQYCIVNSFNDLAVYNAEVVINGGTYTLNVPETADGAYLLCGQNFTVNSGIFTVNNPHEIPLSYVIFAENVKVEKVVKFNGEVAAAQVGNTYYRTFEDAFAAAKAGDTIILWDDITLAEKLTIDKALTLDLNGKTLKLAPVADNYSVVIKDDFTITGNGNVIIDTYFGFGLGTTYEGTFTIENGTFTQTYGYYMIGAYSGKVLIKDGTFKADDCIINSFNNNSSYDAEVVIEGGKFTSDITNTYTGEYSTAVLLGHNFKLNAGTFEMIAPEGALNSYVVFAENVTKADGVKFIGEVAAAQIGNTYYVTFEDAFAAAKAGDTIILWDDITLVEKLTIDKALTLDLNGKTLKLAPVADNYSVVIKDDFTITGNGNVIIDTYFGFGLGTTYEGTFTIENGTFTQTSGYYMIGAYSGKVVIKDGTFKSDDCIINSFNDKPTYDAEVVIEGGTFTSDITNTYTGEYSTAVLLGHNFALNAGTFEMIAPEGALNSYVVFAENVTKADEVKFIGEVAAAQIGNTYYVSFEDAFAAAKAGDTIILWDDITLVEKLTIDKALTLDLNGKTLKLAPVADNYSVVIKDDFTITGNGSVLADTPYAIGTSTKFNGTFTIENGTFVQSNGIYLIGMFSGELVVNGGSFVSEYCIINSFDGYNAEVVVNGGDFSVNVPEEADSAYVICGHSFTLNGGKFTINNPYEIENCYVIGATDTIISDSVVINGKQAPVMIGENNFFRSLDDAVAFAKAGDTLVLCDNVAVEEIYVDKSIVIDLNGYTISSINDSVSFEIVNNGMLKIVDSSLMSTRSLPAYNNPAFHVNGGALVIENGVFTEGKAGYVVKVTVGTAEINGGNFLVDSCVAMAETAEASIKVNGGVYTLSDNATPDATFFSGDGVNVYGGTYSKQLDKQFAVENSVAIFNETESTYTYYASLQNAVEALADGETIVLYNKVELKEALIIDKDVVIELNNNEIVLACTKDYSITVNAALALNNGNVTATSGSKGILNNGSLIIEGGVYTQADSALIVNNGNVDVISGSVNSLISDEFIGDRNVLVDEFGSHVNVQIDLTKVVARIDNFYFTTIDLAVNSVKNNQTIVIVSDNVKVNETLTVKASGISLDLNGKYLEANTTCEYFFYIESGASLTLCGVGTIYTGQNFARLDGTLILKDNVVIRAEQKAVVADSTIVGVAPYLEIKDTGVWVQGAIVLGDLATAIISGGTYTQEFDEAYLAENYNILPSGQWYTVVEYKQYATWMLEQEKNKLIDSGDYSNIGNAELNKLYEAAKVALANCNLSDSTYTADIDDILTDTLQAYQSVYPLTKAEASQSEALLEVYQYALNKNVANWPVADFQIELNKCVTDEMVEACVVEYKAIIDEIAKENVAAVLAAAKDDAKLQVESYKVKLGLSSVDVSLIEAAKNEQEVKVALETTINTLNTAFAAYKEDALAELGDNVSSSARASVYSASCVSEVDAAIATAKAEIQAKETLEKAKQDALAALNTYAKDYANSNGATAAMYAGIYAATSTDEVTAALDAAKAEIKSVHDLNTKILGMKDEIAGKVQSLETKLDGVKTDLDSAIQGVKTELETKVKTLSDKLAALSGDVTEIKTKVGEIESSITTLSSDIATKVDELKKLIADEVAEIEKLIEEKTSQGVDTTEIEALLDTKLSALEGKINSSVSSIESTIAEKTTALNNKVAEESASLQTQINDKNAELAEIVKAENEDSKQMIILAVIAGLVIFQIVIVVCVGGRKLKKNLV